jgi:hypothetical protein
VRFGRKNRALEVRKRRAAEGIGGPLAVSESFPRARADAPALECDIPPPVSEVGGFPAEDAESAGEEEVSASDWWASQAARGSVPWIGRGGARLRLTLMKMQNLMMPTDDARS